MLQRRLWKLRAMTEEKLDELAQQFGGAQASRCDDLDEEDDDDEERSSRRDARVGPGAVPAPSAREELERRLAEARARRRASGRRRGAARLSGVRPGGWHRSPAGFLRRTLQAADENNIPFLASALTFDALLAAVPFVLLLLIGLTHLAQATAGRHRPVDAVGPVPPLLPAAHLDARPRSVRRWSRRLLVRISENRGQISLYAVPAFVWFSTRLFAGIRTSLNDIYDVSARPGPAAAFPAHAACAASCATSAWWSRP